MPRKRNKPQSSRQSKVESRRSKVKSRQSTVDSPQDLTASRQDNTASRQNLTASRQNNTASRQKKNTKPVILSEAKDLCSCSSGEGQEETAEILRFPESDSPPQREEGLGVVGASTPTSPTTPDPSLPRSGIVSVSGGKPKDHGIFCQDDSRASRDAREDVTVLTSLGPVLQLLPYQRRWVEDDSHLKIVVKARQIGYSFAASIRALLECLKKKTTWIFLSKGERQSRLLMEKVQEHIKSCGILARACESSFFEGTLIKQLEVRFANGSVIYGLPANPDTARGYSGNVTLDEFAFHADADKIYAALFPTITRGYGLEVISTPNGQQGKFYELAKAAGLTESGDREIGRSGEQSKLETLDEFRLSNLDSSVQPIIVSPDHPIIRSPGVVRPLRGHLRGHPPGAQH